MMRKLLCAVFLLVGGLLWLDALPAVAESNSPLQLAQRIQAVHAQYQAERQMIILRINRSYGIDYEALHRVYQARAFFSRQKSQKGPEDPLYQQYVEARLVLENELERDHLLKARCLDAYEKILEDLIRSDPLLTHFFDSPEYRQHHGLLLKRVVWEISQAEAASTKALDAYTVFSDRRQTPFLIKVGPTAFTSLSYLRSILVHELNHVLIYKEPRFESLFAELERFSSKGENVPQRTPPGIYGLFFNLRYGRTPVYQYYLLHEYYSFRAQLLYDETAPDDPHRRLSSEDRRQIERLADWAYGELNARNKEFVKKNPYPPMQEYILKFRS